jgi:glycosyltransferase involved in cell wall biosynthesis
MGVLEPRKRFDLLLKSFSMIAKPSDILLIAGTGPQKHMLENLAKKLKIESQVRFLGYVQNVDKLMNNSDILVLTSSSEALPMVLLEGLATGLQVVSTNSFSGPSEVLGNGRYGFLAEVNNLKSIVSSMRAAIDTPISQEIIFEGATRYSTDNIVNQYLKFIEKIIKDEGNLYASIKPKLVPERKLRKKVLINISVITPIYRGMSVFTKQIIKRLIKNDNYDFIFVSGNELDQEIFQLIIDSNSTYKQINAPLPIFDQIVVPYLINKFKPNFCWFPSNTFPLILNNKSKYIVTVHDLIFLMDQYKVPSFYQKIAKYYRVLNILIGIKRVEKITSVSKTTMSDLYAKFKISKKIDNQEVFYNTLHIEEDEDDNIFKKLSIDPADKFFYSIVGPGKHKNVDFLIESFKRVQKIKNNYKLVISGILNKEFKKESNDIIFTPFISEKEKTSLIKNAELFIFPSLAEGFGIPLLEGLYHNPKVLVSDIPIFREIGKSHVRYFDPYDKNFLIKYLKDDIQKSNHEEAKNYILKKFDVSKSVNKLEKIFAEIE